MKNHELLKKLGKECAQLRKKCKITQQQMADMLGYSKENISAFENGRNGNVIIYRAYMEVADVYRHAMLIMEGREENDSKRHS